ncbi:MAG: response regulator transcription factor [Patescibacteria group bacterium]
MRILVVEDEKDIREFLKAGLESECFIVDTAEDGEKGSFLARTNDYDLVILDLIMPNKSGQEVCRDIREAGKNFPILVLSVQTEIPTKVELFNMGADDYLTKPYSIEELLARIRALLRRPRVIENEVLEFEDLTVDPKKHLVKRGQKEIYLTRKEFMLLEYLLKNKQQVLSRAMIMEHVWDVDADPFSNTIESHILSLRKKIDVKSKPKLIHTIPGRGYKLDVKR